MAYLTEQHKTRIIKDMRVWMSENSWHNMRKHLIAATAEDEPQTALAEVTEFLTDLFTRGMREQGEAALKMRGVK